MEIRLENLNSDEYDIRDEVDEDHVSDIAESLESDGQWNPIIVRPDGEGEYDIIAGHTRYRAAKQLGWETLEATVKDVEEPEAEQLALKTNLKREPMSKIEEGKVINNILDREDLTQSQLAERLGRSKEWVSDRIRVALDLKPEVKGLVQEGKISYSLAREVRRVDEDDQLEFAKMLIEENVTTSGEASKLRLRFENDTIYTVGYQGRSFEEFVDKLQEASIDILVDIRASGESTYKPQFSADYLSNQLPQHGIEYRHEPELGVHRVVRSPYKDNSISHQCFADWYDWWLNQESDIEIEKLADDLVSTGVPALMCIERYAEPKGDQNIYCHRHHLADKISSVEQHGRALFPNRVDL